jgi:hypothetical protein
MATLYASTNTARKFLIFFLIFAVVVLIWDNIGSLPGASGTQEDNRFFMKANRTFGDLPEFKLNSIPLNTSVKPQYIYQSTFSETFPDVSYVYQILQPRENFQFLSTFEKTADTFGFETAPTVDGNTYSWKSQDGSKTLRYNSVSQVWSLDTDLPANADARSAVLTLNTASNYESRLKSLLKNARFDSKGFEDAVYSVKFLDLNSDGEMIANENPLTSEFGFGTAHRVLPLADLKPSAERPELKKGQVLPTPFEGKVYTADPRKGSFTTLFSYNMGDMEKDLFELDFINFEYTQIGAYQIITPIEGFSRIQEGQGALVSLTQPTLDYFENIENASVTKFSIDAKRTEIAFYEPQEWIGYTYPIYIYYGTAELSNGGLANATFFIDAVKRAN